jgi:MFS transporter, ACS family, allantoate permease
MEPKQEEAVRDLLDSHDADQALQFSLAEGAELNDALSKAVCRKIDRRLLPWLVFLFTVQYFDKISLSFAAVMGILDDTGLTNARYAWSVDSIPPSRCMLNDSC